MTINKRIEAYKRLIRLHSPAAIMLLAWPGFFSLAVNLHNLFALNWYILFAIGAFLTRSAGCIINDLVDKKFDKQITRTKSRPIANDEVSKFEALSICAVLSAGALWILLSFNNLTILVGFIAAMMIVVYPFMKRFTYWPHIFFAMTFQVGAVIVCTAVTGKINFATCLIYLGCIFWGIAYDVIYSYQDAEDDVKAGVKSAALVLKEDGSRWISFFYKCALVCFVLAGAALKCHALFYLFMVFALVYIFWQNSYIDLSDPKKCFFLFKANNLFGLLIWLAFVIGRI